MDKKKLETFKKRLEERQRELRQAVSRTAQDGRDADLESAQDIADRAANSYNKEFLFHQSNNDRQLLQMVDGALDRIRDGAFGQCISCGEEINPKRLEAVPWTRHCIECQERLKKACSSTPVHKTSVRNVQSRPDQGRLFVAFNPQLTSVFGVRFHVAAPQIAIVPA